MGIDWWPWTSDGITSAISSLCAAASSAMNGVGPVRTKVVGNMFSSVIVAVNHPSFEFRAARTY
jgi:hypothetical protein